jgi:hypothetical protein
VDENPSRAQAYDSRAELAHLETERLDSVEGAGESLDLNIEGET